MRLPGRRAFSRLDLALLAVFLGLVAFVMLPTYIKSSVSDEIQRCYATQRRLHAALDAYETDTKEKLPRMQAALQTLLKNGYISELPLDPGDERPSSTAHYGRNADGAVYCWVHGSPWPYAVRPQRDPPDVRFIGPLMEPKKPSPRPMRIPGTFR